MTRRLQSARPSCRPALLGHPHARRAVPRVPLPDQRRRTAARRLPCGHGRHGSARLRHRRVTLPKEYVRTAVSATITPRTNSLIGAFDAHGVKMFVPLQLAEMFSGEIDFNSDLQQGDRFDVLFDRATRDGEFVGYGDIQAAVIHRWPAADRLPLHRARRESGVVRRAGPVADAAVPSHAAAVRPACDVWVLDQPLPSRCAAFVVRTWVWISARRRAPRSWRWPAAWSPMPVGRAKRAAWCASDTRAATRRFTCTCVVLVRASRSAPASSRPGHRLRRHHRYGDRSSPRLPRGQERHVRQSADGV